MLIDSENQITLETVQPIAIFLGISIEKFERIPPLLYDDSVIARHELQLKKEKELTREVIKN